MSVIQSHVPLTFGTKWFITGDYIKDLQVPFSHYLSKTPCYVYEKSVPRKFEVWRLGDLMSHNEFRIIDLENIFTAIFPKIHLGQLFQDWCLAVSSKLPESFSTNEADDDLFSLRACLEEVPTGNLSIFPLLHQRVKMVLKQIDDAGAENLDSLKELRQALDNLLNKIPTTLEKQRVFSKRLHSLHEQTMQLHSHWSALEKKDLLDSIQETNEALQEIVDELILLVKTSEMSSFESHLFIEPLKALAEKIVNKPEKFKRDYPHPDLNDFFLHELDEEESAAEEPLKVDPETYLFLEMAKEAELPEEIDLHLEENMWQTLCPEIRRNQFFALIDFNSRTKPVKPAMEWLDLATPRGLPSLGALYIKWKEKS